MRQVSFTELRANMARYFDQLEADRDEFMVIAGKSEQQWLEIAACRFHYGRR